MQRYSAASVFEELNQNKHTISNTATFTTADPESDEWKSFLKELDAHPELKYKEVDSPVDSVDICVYLKDDTITDIQL